jgi:tRNA nucleotidyltransferase/poly(A) polymerase
MWALWRVTRRCCHHRWISLEHGNQLILQSLTPFERTVFDELTAAVTAAPIPVELKIVGGWVRDKLLCRSLPQEAPLDLDLVANGVSLESLQAALESGGFPYPASWYRRMDSSAVSSRVRRKRILVYQLRDAKIEIAPLRVLESESSPGDDGGAAYLPAVTAEWSVDAFLRDCTVNALFFDLRSRQLEDRSGQGLADIEHRVLRAPIPPAAMLAMDPLRAFRILRLSAELGLTIDADLYRCLAAADWASLLAGVDRSRIGAETMRGFGSAQPVTFARLLEDTQLVKFCGPPTVSSGTARSPAVAVAYLADLVPLARPTHLLAVFLAAHLDISHGQELSALNPWAYSREVTQLLKTFLWSRSLFPVDDIAAPERFSWVRWLLAAGPTAWKTLLSVGYAQADIGTPSLSQLRELMSFLEDRYQHYFSHVYAVSWDDILTRFPALAQTPALAGQLLEAARMSEIERCFHQLPFSKETSLACVAALLESPSRTVATRG